MRARETRASQTAPTPSEASPGCAPHLPQGAHTLEQDVHTRLQAKGTEAGPPSQLHARQSTTGQCDLRERDKMQRSLALLP